MTIEDAIKSLQFNYEALISNAATDCLNIAFDIKALIALRIQTTGKNYIETPFSPYTVPHKKVRQKKGYQTEYVDFTMTGELWNNIQPTVRSATEESTLVIIGAQSQRNIDILKGAVRKRGNILRLTEAEIDLLIRLNRQRVMKYFNP
jgi:hypothetical protein